MDVRITVETIFDNGEKRAVRRMRTGLRYPSPSFRSGREKATPFSESGGAVQLEILSVVEGALQVEMVVDRGVNRGEFLQRSHAPEPHYGPLSSSERQVRVLGPVVEPAPRLTVIPAAEVLQGSTIGPKAIGNDHLRPTVPLHGFLEKSRCGLAVTSLRHEAFEHLTFMMNSPPEVTGHAVDPHEDLVEVPTPVPTGAHAVNALASDFSREHRPEPVPPKSHCLMADLDPALMQQVFDVPQQKREADIKHHREADDLWDRLEVAERGAFGHTGRLARRPIPRQEKFI